MARQAATAIENNFVGGLVTETTALKFPPNACTDTDNCVFDETGRVTRRLGIDIEENAGSTTIVPEDSDVYTEFVWSTVGGDGNISFLVQQQANFLFFYDVSDNVTPSANAKSFTVDLDAYLVTGSARDPATEQCQYTIHDGNLVVVNPACDPISIVYSSVSDDITVIAITIQIRDFAGVDDGMDLTERPTSTVADLITNEPEHYYNLLNQGWYHGSTGTGGPDTAATLAQWDTARTDLPSNADVVGLYRSSETDAFDNANVLAQSPGTTPAPKGHFIFSATEQDRDAAALAEGFTVTLGVVPSFISAATGSAIGDMLDTHLAFDGVSNIEAPASVFTGAHLSGVTNCYIGKNFSGAPKQIERVIAFGSNNQGYAYSGDTFSDYTGNITITLYGKVGAPPVSSSDGTVLDTVSFNDAANESSGRVLSSSDQTTFFDFVWVRVERTDTVAHIFVVTELQLYQPGSTGSAIPSTTERPNTVTTYAGRIFYAGINGLGLNSSIFFTQVLEKTAQYGQCYQKNDPTAEDFSDLLPDDGGVVKIPEIGKIIKLFGFQTSLVVLATNGVWLVSGGSGSAFAANDYTVRKLSSVGTDSPMSVVDYKGLPIWWGDDGINTIQFDANYDSFSVVSATDQTIKSFILNIPGINRKYVKGVFDVNSEAVYWIFNDDVALTSSNYYIYNRALLLNGLSKAFYPWSINVAADVPSIRGIAYILEGQRTNDPVVKLTTTLDTSLSYADVRDTTYTDWTSSHPADYTSYFITGYRIDGQTQKFFQSNYVFVFLEELENSGCYMQGIFDFTTDQSTGKWSTAQQVYNSTHLNRSVRIRRLKVRGKGRALQLRFESEAGKPFSIIGWSLFETVNSDL